jgi:lysophospholipase L1-like esterase
MKSNTRLKTLTAASIAVNLIFGSLFLYFIYSKGGVSYIRNKLGKLVPQEEQQETAIGKRPYFYKLLSSLYEKMPYSSEDIIFVGDSHIKLCPWSELLKNHNIKNRGIGGDTVGGVLERIDHLIQAQPDKIFVLAGNNDINRGIYVPRIIDDYEKLVALIRQKSPITQIHILSVLPFGKSYPNYQQANVKISLINSELKQIAIRKKIEFVDLFPILADNDNHQSAQYSYDGLHLNTAGYELVAAALQPFLNNAEH